MADGVKSSLQDRLQLEANRLQLEADTLPHGPERDAIIRKARQLQTASHMDEWLSSPGLQPPK